MKENSLVHPLVSWVKTPKSLLQQYLHRRPAADFSWRFDDENTNQQTIENHVRELRDDGITMFPDYFDERMLANLRSSFERALSLRPTDKGNNYTFASYDFMDIDPSFVAAATEPLLLEVVSRYYHKKFGLARTDALRLEPMAPERYGSFQWHHDSRGKQVKMQILLTDVSPEGQKMSFLKGSHQQYYSYRRARGEGSRFEVDIESALQQAKVTNVTGKAGTVCLFDTNGLHTGNRNLSARRDTLTFYLSTPESHNYQPIRYLKKDIESLDSPRRDVVLYNSSAEVV